MKVDRYDKFTALGIIAHVLLFAAGYVFVGIEYTVLLFLLWGITWMLYCGSVADKWDASLGSYDEKVSIPALALVGGPLCWMLCPACLIPSMQRKAGGFSMPWLVAQRAAHAVRGSVLTSAGILHRFCEREFPAADPAKDDNL